MTDTPPPAPDAAPARTGFLGGRAFDLLLGLGVLMISVVSLVVAVSANRTQERMLAASVWPSLQFATSNVSVDGEPQITFDLLNRGVGPARVQWAEVSLQGEPMPDLRTLLARCCGDESATNSFTSGIQRRVLAAGENVQVVHMDKDGSEAAVYDALNLARQGVSLRACYCSVLDDCWLLDTRRTEPEPVDACPAPPAVPWHG